MTVTGDIESIRMSRVKLYSDAWYALSYFQDCAQDSVRYDYDTCETNGRLLGSILANDFLTADRFKDASVLVRQLADDVEAMYDDLRIAGESPLPLAHMTKHLLTVKEQALTALAQCQLAADPKPPTRKELTEWI